MKKALLKEADIFGLTLCYDEAVGSRMPLLNLPAVSAHTFPKVISCLQRTFGWWRGEGCFEYYQINFGECD